jgi:hypothetical protein
VPGSQGGHIADGFRDPKGAGDTAVARPLQKPFECSFHKKRRVFLDVTSRRFRTRSHAPWLSRGYETSGSRNNSRSIGKAKAGPTTGKFFVVLRWKWLYECVLNSSAYREQLKLSPGPP